MPDDEDYIAYGTPIEDEQQSKGQYAARTQEGSQTRALPVWKQVRTATMPAVCLNGSSTQDAWSTAEGGCCKDTVMHACRSLPCVLLQEVTDEQGRRRFHGAFTGGYSAGFFNTVGSKEGWAPQTFMSTRAGKAVARCAPDTGNSIFSTRGQMVYCISGQAGSVLLPAAAMHLCTQARC